MSGRDGGLACFKHTNRTISGSQCDRCGWKPGDVGICREEMIEAIKSHEPSNVEARLSQLEKTMAEVVDAMVNPKPVSDRDRRIVEWIDAGLRGGIFEPGSYLHREITACFRVPGMASKA